MKKTIVLAILDGFGYNPSTIGNAIYGNTPNIDKIKETATTTLISAAGEDVGLPDGQMGNSEVGHTNIGAGRIVYQELTRISKAIRDGDFFENEALIGAMNNCKKNGTALHLIGLLSDGGVHSHNSHLYAIVELAKRMGLEKVYVHPLMDGRDVSPTSGIDFIKELQDKMSEIGCGKIASIIGRYYAMDRDNRWDRVLKAYLALTCNEGEFNNDPVDVMKQSYANNITDEFIVPTICDKDGAISENDSVIFFNFRPDRAREITRVFVDPDFNGFDRKKGFFPLHYVCFTQYDVTMPNVAVAFSPQELTNTLGEFLSNNDKTQLRIAETEKYAHVTFFFNGGKEATFKGEDRVLVPSPKVATYDLQPEMSAPEVCDKVCDNIRSGKYDVVILNYANCDMVGHTGIMSAAAKAVKAVDACVAKTYEAVKAVDGVLLITADHGNADQMLAADGVSPFTAHTTNKVPFIVANYPCSLRENAVLADISPTIIKILNLPKPSEMTGTSIIE
ncbi:MAG: 2,3-bisphosphoglycerate-independent phosphoglycerate mutase [Clostridia bacterium]